MCEVSDKIKFCTCANNDTIQDANYWVLYRFNKRKNISVMGDAILPYLIDLTQDETNRQILLKAVNDPASFDKPVAFENGDLFMISLKWGEEPGERLEYGFRFNKGRWEEKTFNYFDWQTKHDKKASGQIENGLKG